MPTTAPSASRTLPSRVSASLRATRWARTSVSVSLARVTPASVRSARSDRGVVDDAVVDHRDAARLVGVRVGVGVGRRAVGGPPRVPDAGRAGEALGQRLGQVAHPAGLLGHLDPATAQDRDPRRVVAAVLEAREPLEHDGSGVLAADVADDSTHLLGLPCEFGACCWVVLLRWCCPLSARASPLRLAVDDPAQLALAELGRRDDAPRSSSAIRAKMSGFLAPYACRWACRSRTQASTGWAWKAITSSTTRAASAGVSDVVATTWETRAGSGTPSACDMAGANANFLPEIGQIRAVGPRWARRSASDTPPSGAVETASEPHECSSGADSTDLSEAKVRGWGRARLGEQKVNGRCRMSKKKVTGVPVCTWVEVVDPVGPHPHGGALDPGSRSPGSRRLSDQHDPRP